MTPEEQLRVIEVVAAALKDASADVRKEALHCLVGLGTDGLGRIVDVIDDAATTPECRAEAVRALGNAFAEGRVDKSGMIKTAIHALETCLARDDKALAEAAVDALGDIGTLAIAAKPKLLALLDGTQDNRLRVKATAALLKVSPVH